MMYATIYNFHVQCYLYRRPLAPRCQATIVMPKRDGGRGALNEGPRPWHTSAVDRTSSTSQARQCRPIRSLRSILYTYPTNKNPPNGGGLGQQGQPRRESRSTPMPQPAGLPARALVSRPDEG